MNEKIKEYIRNDINIQVINLKNDLNGENNFKVNINGKSHSVMKEMKEGDENGNC